MEIADIFVVNKADHPMADQLRREIRSMMEMLHARLGAGTRGDAGGRGEGIDELVSCDRAPRRLSQRDRRDRNGGDATRSIIRCASSRSDGSEQRLDERCKTQARDGVDPYEAADRILSDLGL